MRSNITFVLFDYVQGSNLALANLLNASSFLLTPSLAIFSMWRQVALISTKLCNTALYCMANSVDPDQPASSECDLDPHCLQGSLNISSES